MTSEPPLSELVDAITVADTLFKLRGKYPFEAAEYYDADWWLKTFEKVPKILFDSAIVYWAHNYETAPRLTGLRHLIETFVYFGNTKQKPDKLVELLDGLAGKFPNHMFDTLKFIDLLGTVRPVILEEAFKRHFVYLSGPPSATDIKKQISYLTGLKYLIDKEVYETGRPARNSY